MPQQDPTAPLPPFPNYLKDRTALVTGGASGLGAAIASRLAIEGTIIWIADIDLSGAESHAAIAAVSEKHDSLDILADNAGITTMGSIETLDVDAFRHELGVDAIGVWVTRQLCQF